MKQKRQLRKIIVAAVLFASAFLVPPLPWLRPALFAAAYLTVGLEIIQKAVRNIFYGQVFDENFLMTVATLGAFGLGEYSEGVAAVLSGRRIFPVLRRGAVPQINCRADEHPPRLCQSAQRRQNC